MQETFFFIIFIYNIKLKVQQKKYNVYRKAINIGVLVELDNLEDLKKMQQLNSGQNVRLYLQCTQIQ